jgi:hypothetical protein
MHTSTARTLKQQQQQTQNPLVLCAIPSLPASAALHQAAFKHKHHAPQALQVQQLLHTSALMQFKTHCATNCLVA